MNVRVLASGSSGNCYLLGYGSGDRRRWLMVEAGIPLSRIRRETNFRLDLVDGALVSHAHKDHCRAVPELMRAGVDCYMGPETAGALQDAKGQHRLTVVSAGRAFSIQGPCSEARGWRVLPFRLAHDVPTLGYLIARGRSKVLYVADTAYVRQTFKGLTHIMVEANYGEALLRGKVEAGEVDPAVKRRVYGAHMSIERTLKMLAANDLSRVVGIWLLHLSDDNSDAAEFKRLVEAATGIPTVVAGSTQTDKFTAADGLTSAIDAYGLRAPKGPAEEDGS